MRELTPEEDALMREALRNSGGHITYLEPASQPVPEDELTDFLCDAQDRIGPGCDERALAQALLRTYSISSTQRPLCSCKASARDGQHMSWCSVSSPLREGEQ